MRFKYFSNFFAHRLPLGCKTPRSRIIEENFTLYSTDPEVINFFSLIDTSHINLAVDIGLELWILILIIMNCCSSPGCDFIQRFRFKKIDAFVEGQSTGNPAGCVYLQDQKDLSVEGMQQIARELAGFVSEVVYVYPDEGHTGLRYFSSEREVSFCGHATIAVMYDLIKNDEVLARDPIVRIHVQGRDLLVRNEIASADAVFISAPLPGFLDTDLTRDDIAAALKIPPGDIAEKNRIMLVDAGLATLIIPLTSLDVLLSLHPDQKHLREFCLAKGIEIILVFSEEVSIKVNNYHTRVFAPIYGYLEDPATGSGNAALGYYLLNAGLWDGQMLKIEQGRNRERPNIIRLVSDASKVQRSVFFGGNARVRIEGEYLFYP